MKDTTRLEKINGDTFKVDRQISENIKESRLREQLKRLEHTKEQLEGQMDNVERRMGIIKEALEDGEAVGDTTMVNIKDDSVI